MKDTREIWWVTKNNMIKVFSINRRTFMKYAKKKNISGKIKVFVKSSYDSRVGGIVPIGTNSKVDIKELFNNREVYYDKDIDKFVSLGVLGDYEITDERFDELKTIMKKIMIVKGLDEEKMYYNDYTAKYSLDKMQEAYMLLRGIVSKK